MSFLIMLASSASQVLKTRTFTQNETWIAPSTTSLLTTVSGKGAAGRPASRDTYYIRRKEFTVDYDPGFGNDNVTNTFSKVSTGLGDYCDPWIYVASAHANTRYCYYYTYIEEDVPATTGASATGFDKVFPGGFGGAATVSSFANVAVSPGQPYNIVVPPGGSITITYFE